MKRFSVCVGWLIVLGLFASSTLVFAESTNISGKWIMKVVTPKVNGTATFTFQQNGEKLTGMYAGSLGEAPVTGIIKGNDAVFKFTTDPQKGYAIYTGKVDGKEMVGTVDFAGVAKGTFDGKMVD